VHCKIILSAVYSDSSLKRKVMANRRDVQTTGLEERQRDPSQNQGRNWNPNLQFK